MIENFNKFSAPLIHVIFHKYTLFILLCVSLFLNGFSLPTKFRLVGIGDLSKEMTLVFDSPDNPKIYYGLNPNTVNNLTSAFILPDPNVTNDSFGMLNNICRFTNLQANTKYYFKVVDGDGNSDLYHFYTLPNDNTPLSIIAGGCSRNIRSVRVLANKMVAKLKPHAVIFTGDFTDNGNSQQWQAWFDDWQNTIDTDGRLTPIIPARGNHENNNRELSDLFGTNSTMHYSSYNNSLLSIITLNTEATITFYSAQTDWLQNTLSQTNTTYKIIQYHKPIRSHITYKIDNASAYFFWAKVFEDNNVDLVVESDTHNSKTTWPVSVCTGGLYCVDGFKRDDVNGVVYTGDGGWGVPTRPADDNRIWTHQSGQLNQFKWMLIYPEKMELRTVKYENVDEVDELSINNRFQLPQNIDIYGEVTTIKASNNLPQVNNYPKNNSTFVGIQPISLLADIENTTKSIDQVAFYINGILVGNYNSAPYLFEDWMVTDYGTYTFTSITTFSSGETQLAESYFQVIEPIQTTLTQLNSAFDDAEESSRSKVDVTNWDLDLGYNGTIVGLRFQNVNIPPGATVTNAYIQFTADERKLNTTSLTIYGERKINAETFSPNDFNISNRTKTNNNVNWDVANWETVGDNGQAEKTPDLSNIMNEIINLNGHSLQYPFVFIIEGSGYRVSEAYEGSPDETAVLHYTYIADDCTPNLVISQSTPFNNSQISNGTIVTNGLVSINAGEQMEYKANEIILNNNFSVAIGAEFDAKVGTCY